MNACPGQPLHCCSARLVLGFLPLIAMGCSAGDRTDDAPPTADTPADILLARSIAFHDPEGIWGTSPLEVEWSGTGADGTPRVAVEFTLFPNGDRFEMHGRYRGSDLVYQAEGDTWSATVDGETPVDPEVIQRMRLDREDGFFWRSYYGFLAGLPMKLLDPGTRIDAEPVSTSFDGEEVLAIRVSYDPEVGMDTWYFYFDPETAALVGCRFYHDEPANDGEYIVLEGLMDANGMRLPRHRRWYVNADDQFLGADEIVAAGSPDSD